MARRAADHVPRLVLRLRDGAGRRRATHAGLVAADPCPCRRLHGSTRRRSRPGAAHPLRSRCWHAGTATGRSSSMSSASRWATLPLSPQWRPLTSAVLVMARRCKSAMSTISTMHVFPNLDDDRFSALREISEFRIERPETLAASASLAAAFGSVVRLDPSASRRLARPAAAELAGRLQPRACAGN